MTDQSFTTTFSVDRSPQEVFDAINDVRAWWSAEVEGPTDVEGETFTFRVKDLHRSQIRVSELVPGERVVWTVLENYMSFVEDQTEWVDTQIRFDLTDARRWDGRPVHPRRTPAGPRVLRRVLQGLGLLPAREPAEPRHDRRGQAGGQAGRRAARARSRASSPGS